MPAPKENEQKVQRAFEIVERLEKSEKSRSARNASGTGIKTAHKAHEKSGLRIHFGLDALVSERDTRDAGEKNLRSGSSKLIDIRFTVPYIWRIPVVGKAALKILNHFQGENYPESIRDILSSFRRDKNR
jgi:hypothetical protein